VEDRGFPAFERAELARALRNIGHPQSSVRLVALSSLTSNCSRRTAKSIVNVLIDVASDPEAEVRHQAVLCLGRSAGLAGTDFVERACEVLLRSTYDPEPLVRSAAICALGDFHGSVPEDRKAQLRVRVLDLTSDAHEVVRLSAIGFLEPVREFMTQAEARRTAARIFELLEDRSDSVQSSAANTLTCYQDVLPAEQWSFVLDASMRYSERGQTAWLRLPPRRWRRRRRRRRAKG